MNPRLASTSAVSTHRLSHEASIGHEGSPVQLDDERSHRSICCSTNQTPSSSPYHFRGTSGRFLKVFNMCRTFQQVFEVCRNMFDFSQHCSNIPKKFSFCLRSSKHVCKNFENPTATAVKLAENICKSSNEKSFAYPTIFDCFDFLMFSDAPDLLDACLSFSTSSLLATFQLLCACASSETLRVIVQGLLETSHHALHESFELLSTRPNFDCSSSWAHNLLDRACRRFRFCKEYL